MKCLKQTFATAIIIGGLTVLVSPASFAETSVDAQYMSYNTAIMKMTTNINARRDAIRSRFPFNPELFDSKKVTIIERRPFPQPNFKAHDNARFDTSFRPPSEKPGVITKQTGQEKRVSPRQNILGDDFQPSY